MQHESGKCKEKPKLKMHKHHKSVDFDVKYEKFCKDETHPSLQIYNVPKTSWKPSIVPIITEIRQKKETEIQKQKAYDLYCQVHDKKNKYAEDAKSFFCNGEATWNPSPLTKRSSSILVGTDCSGIEAPIIALINMGIPFIHNFSSDIDKDAVRTIKANTPPLILYDDLHKRDNTKAAYVDLYVAGFPCQPFSTMGKQEGFDDARGTVFFGILDYITHQLPKVFILENVKGLVTMQNGKLLQTIMKLLRSIRDKDGKKAYIVKQAIMDTKELGIPHSRPRWYCVGIRKDAPNANSFAFPGPVDCPG